MGRASKYVNCLVLLAFLALITSACTKRYNFQYEPEPIEGAKQSDLRIAVMPFGDERKLIDEGSKNLAYVPLVPTSANVKDAPQSEMDRHRGVYYYPDLVAFGIALDVGANKLGSVAHFNPEMKEDYDLIIEGSVLSLAQTDRNLTYGLSVAAPLTQMIGLPQGSKGIDFKARYIIKKHSGEVLYDQIHESDWSSVQQGMPFMEGINSTIREGNTAFLTAALPVLEKTARKDLAPRRKRQFYAALDPSLRNLDAERRRLLRQW